MSVQKKKKERKKERELSYLFFHVKIEQTYGIMKILRKAKPLHWLYANQNRVVPNDMLPPETVLRTIKFRETVPELPVQGQKGYYNIVVDKLPQLSVMDFGKVSVKS